MFSWWWDSAGRKHTYPSFPRIYAAVFVGYLLSYAWWHVPELARTLLLEEALVAPPACDDVEKKALGRSQTCTNAGTTHDTADLCMLLQFCEAYSRHEVQPQIGDTHLSCSAWNFMISLNVSIQQFWLGVATWMCIPADLLFLEGGLSSLHPEPLPSLW